MFVVAGNTNFCTWHFYSKSFVIKTVLSLIFLPNQSNYIVNLSELRYKNITEDKSFSYLTKHVEYLTLTFLIQFWLENTTGLTLISNSPLSTWDLYTSNINLDTLENIVFIFDWRVLFFERIAGIWETLLLLANCV